MRNLLKSILWKIYFITVDEEPHQVAFWALYYLLYLVEKTRYIHSQNYQ